MSSFGESWRFLKQEARAERRAVLEIDETSSVDILRRANIPITYPSFEERKDRKGNVIKKIPVGVRGQDITGNTTWKKFLRHINRKNADLISLINDREWLIQSFDSFLENNYTERYSNLDAEGKIWRVQVVRKAVTYHIMQNKLDGYLLGEETFADDRVAYYMKLNRAIKIAMDKTASLLQHIIQDEEKAEFYLSEIFSNHSEHLKETPFPQREDLLRLVESDDEGDDEDNDKGVAI